MRKGEVRDFIAGLVAIYNYLDEKDPRLVIGWKGTVSTNERILSLMCPTLTHKFMHGVVEPALANTLTGFIQFHVIPNTHTHAVRVRIPHRLWEKMFHSHSLGELLEMFPHPLYEELYENFIREGGWRKKE
jgi:hypothetical protein